MNLQVQVNPSLPKPPGGLGFTIFVVSDIILHLSILPVIVCFHCRNAGRQLFYHVRTLPAELRKPPARAGTQMCLHPTVDSLGVGKGMTSTSSMAERVEWLSLPGKVQHTIT